MHRFWYYQFHDALLTGMVEELLLQIFFFNYYISDLKFLLADNIILQVIEVIYFFVVHESKVVLYIS